MLSNIKIFFTTNLARLRPAATRLKAAGHGLQTKLTPKRLALGGLGGLGVLILAQAVLFYWPRNVDFSYTGSTCFAKPQLVPRLVEVQASPRFAASHTSTISIAGYPLYAHAACITAVQAPRAGATETVGFRAFGLGLLQTRVRVASGTLPAAHSSLKPDKPISTKDPLSFTLDRADRVFTYRLSATNRTQSCTARGRTLRCEVAPLQLAQSAQYTLTLERLFGGKPIETVQRQTVSTVEAVRIVGSSIAADHTVYHVPAELTLTLSKPATSLDGVQLFIQNGQARQELPVTASVTGGALTVKFTQPLPRSAALTLSIRQVTAPDGGQLTAPFMLAFKTSGGPKVLGVNIGASRVQPAASMVMTFDVNISGEGLANVVRLEANGTAVPATISARGKTVTITPQASLGRCVALTVKVLDGIKNEFGVSGSSAWQYRSRTICQTVFSIGTSVLGRAITAYRFGNGPSLIVYIGTTHGDETSSTATLNRWVDYLEDNAPRLPGHRSIVVIPTLNPDAYAAGRRTNARNVDLNRNFPSNNWKAAVTMPDKSHNPTGGGTAPLSEPESAAIASYLAAQSPRLVLTYHAVAGVVMPNDAGDSAAIARLYDQNSNLYFAGNSANASLFEYDTTGAMEDWLYDKRGVPALLIELWTKTGNEFPKNQTAMWAVATLP